MNSKVCAGLRGLRNTVTEILMRRFEVHHTHLDTTRRLSPDNSSAAMGIADASIVSEEFNQLLGMMLTSRMRVYRVRMPWG